MHAVNHTGSILSDKLLDHIPSRVMGNKSRDVVPVSAISYQLSLFFLTFVILTFRSYPRHLQLNVLLFPFTKPLSFLNKQYLTGRPKSSTPKKKNTAEVYLFFSKDIIPVRRQIFQYTHCITPKHVNEFAGPISASLHIGNPAPFEEMLPRWQSVCNAVSDLNGPKFEPQTFRSRNVRITLDQQSG